MKNLLIAAMALAGILSSQQASAHYYDVPSRVSDPCGQCAQPAPAPAPVYQGGYAQPLPPPPPPVPGPRAASCGMTFKVQSGDLIVVSGGSGVGHISCTSVDGRIVSEADIGIEILGLGLGLGAYEFAGAAGNLGIYDPADIPGDYWVLDANAAVVLAAGANFGLKSQASGASFAATVEGGIGIGAGIFGKSWRIRLLRPCRYY